jgi:hypothetical protein
VSTLNIVMRYKIQNKMSNHMHLYEFLKNESKINTI